MTIPYERTRAILQTREFLTLLCNTKEAPRVPKRIRERAGSLLKHFPTAAEVEFAHKGAPDHFGPVPPFSRMGATRETQNIIDATK